MTALMSSLTDWVREIIIVVFLAGAVEMLLPETDLRRFARVAMGLFVMLVVAKPILTLVGGSFYFDTGLAALGSWEVRGAGAAARSSREAALEQGSRWAQESRERALVAARAALEAQLVELVLREPGVTDAHVEASLVTDPSSPSYGHLRSVRVIAWVVSGDDEGTGPGAGTGASSAGTGLDQSPVEPVRITVDLSTDRSQASFADGSGSGTASGPREDLAKRLRSVLVLLLGVPPEGIVVEIRP